MKRRKKGILRDYNSGEYIRRASKAETEKSISNSRYDGGAGVIYVNGTKCYVSDS